MSGAVPGGQEHCWGLGQDRAAGGPHRASAGRARGPSPPRARSVRQGWSRRARLLPGREEPLQRGIAGVPTGDRESPRLCCCPRRGGWRQLLGSIWHGRWLRDGFVDRERWGAAVPGPLRPVPFRLLRLGLPPGLLPAVLLQMGNWNPRVCTEAEDSDRHWWQILWPDQV